MAMLCPKCGKESNNIRVCAFCQTPYPTDGSAHSSAPRRTPAVAVLLRSRAVRWGVIGVLALFTVGYYLAVRERTIPTGVAVPNLIEAKMSLNEATAFLKTADANATVELRNGELSVRVSAATFPQQRAGQLAFAQQYARADAMVQGRKRVILFLDPDGAPFAKADPAQGVILTR
jgi:hypothetical protein